MAKLARQQNPAELLDDENPEWTVDDFTKARPASEVLPEIFPKTVADAMLNRSSPQRRIDQALVTLRLSNEVIDAFRATGSGWQSRVDEALKDWLKSHKPVSDH